MATELDEITDEMLENSELEFWMMMNRIPLPQPSEERMKKIKQAIELANLHKIAEESVTFAIDGVGQGLRGVLDTLISLSKGETPNRKN